jgi:hypothetical protein
MFSQISFFKVASVDEIIEAGWVKVSLLGRDILVLFLNMEFVAIESTGPGNASPRTFLPESNHYSKSGSPNFIEKFLTGPAGMIWGKLQHFPVKVVDDYVFVGLMQ